MKAHKNSWYKEWHQWRLHHHFHVAMLVFYTVSVLLGSFATLLPSPNNKALAAALNYDQTFDAGTGLTYDSSKVDVSSGLANLGHHIPNTNWVADSGGGSFNYRKTLTISNSGAAQTNYQVPITITLGADSTKLENDCKDIRFTKTSDGVTPLDYWVESCSATAAKVWVEVDSIAASPANTTIYMYYGNSSAVDASNAVNTFVANGVIDNISGAWDLNENGGNGITVSDSADGNNGTTTNTANVADRYGLNTDVSRARYLDGNGDYIVVPHNTGKLEMGQNAYTISTWFYISGENSQTANQYIVNDYDGNNKVGFHITYNRTNGRYLMMEHAGQPDPTLNAGDSFTQNSTNTSMNDSSWHLITYTRDAAGNYTMYFDGRSDNGYGSGPTSHLTTLANCPSCNPLGEVYNITYTGNLVFGAAYSSAHDSVYVNGKMDDIRIFNGKALSANEVSALYGGAGASSNKTFAATVSGSKKLLAYKYSTAVTNPATINDVDTLTTGNTYHYNDNPSIGNTTAVSMSKLVDFTGTAGGGSTGTFEYQLSPDNGAHWYEWFEGDDWYETTGSTSTIDQAAVDQFNARFATPDTASYMQFKWRAVLISDGTLSQIPKLDEVMFNYYYDTADPDNVVQSDASYGGNSLNQASYYNYNQPIFDWSAYAPLDNNSGGGESSSGIDGYYVLFCNTAWNNDTDCNPATSGYSTYTTGTTYTAPDMTGWTSDNYYLRIKTKDKAGNISNTTSVPFIYHFDVSKPTNPPTLTRTPYAPTDVQNNFRFDWSGATDPDPDGAGSLEASGIAKYQWRRAVDDPVTGWTDTVNTYATGVSAYQIGENLFYVRTVDNAGNVADGYSQIRYLWSGNAPPAPTNLEVVQNDEAGNIQRFRWKAPTHDESILEYRYAVNVADMNENNTVSVDPTPDGSGWIYTPVGSYGTQQGTNTFRVVAKDVLNQVNYTYFAPIEFNVSTPGPGFPTAPVISDISNMDTSKWALALSWDSPSPGGTTVASYVVQRTTTPADDNSWADLATTISTVYADNYQLNNTTTYYYRILSVDNAAKRSTPSDVISRMPTGKYSTKPAIVTGPAASTTATAATITWSTGRMATSFVKYGIGSFGSSVGSNTLATTHSVTLAGLNPGTTYTYKVQSFDEQREYNINDESSWSAAITFSTQAAPGISDVKISDIRLDSAIITWKTTSSATSTLKYGKSNSYGKEISDSSGSVVTTHTVKLSGLDNSSTYHFKIFGTDTDGNQMQSDDYNFDTLTFPRVSNVKFDQIKNTATSTLKVVWDSNVPISSTVRYTDPTGKTIEASQSQLVTKHEMVVSGLKDNTEYSMAVSGRDAYGNEGTSGSEKVKTDFDTRPPAISEITTETSINGYGTDAKTQMIVSWNTDEPSTSQVEYAKGVSGDTFSLATQEDTNLTTSHVVVVSDLDPSSSYYFRVVSKDNSKNEAKSETNSALTEQARSSVFDIVLKSFESTLGWLFGGR